MQIDSKRRNTGEDELIGTYCMLLKKIAKRKCHNHNEKMSHGKCHLE